MNRQYISVYCVRLIFNNKPTKRSRNSIYLCTVLDKSVVGWSGSPSFTAWERWGREAELGIWDLEGQQRAGDWAAVKIGPWRCFSWNCRGSATYVDSISCAHLMINSWMCSMLMKWMYWARQKNSLRKNLTHFSRTAESYELKFYTLVTHSVFLNG